MADCDIIIPVYGAGDHLRRCLSALKRNRPEWAKVWLIDDATPPEKRRGLAELRAALPDWAEWVELPANRGYAGANNHAAGLGKAEYICLLNSDTEPQPGWLDNLRATVEGNPNIGIAGAKLLFPPWSTDAVRPKGRIQHAGVAFNVMRMPFHIFMAWPADHPRVNRPLLMQAVTGACLFTRRDLFESLGGLNEMYGTGNFEDVHFCLEAHIHRGFDVAYVPQAVAFHYGSGSDNTATSERNARMFLNQWEDKVLCDDFLYW